MIDPDNAFTDACEPLTQIPSWWAGFIFHILNPRQFTLYVYLSLLASETGLCHPTTRQIRQDLGLASLTIVFEAISALEEGGFILRRRQNIVALKSRRNVYQRPSCEFTMLRLLEKSLVDGALQPSSRADAMSVESAQLRDQWLRTLLDRDYERYLDMNDAARREFLIATLRVAVRRGPRPDCDAG